MISAQRQLQLEGSIEGAKARQAATVQHSQAKEIAGAKMKPAPAKKGGAKKPKAKAPAAPTAPTTGTPEQANATPYLTGSDLMDVAAAKATAENTDSQARLDFKTAAANAIQQSGDVERSRVANVSGANDDAAARGIYDSGIRLGNVGMANANAGRAQDELQGGVHLAAANAVMQRLGAKNQFADFLKAAAVKAADNGAALPVDPYSTSSKPGANIKGAATRKSTRKTKR